MEQFAEIYVTWIEPFGKAFLFFMLVMLVLSFWAKAKEGKLFEMPGVIFNATMTGLYNVIYYTGVGIWAVFTFISRVFRVAFATLRDFFISRI